MNRDAILQAAQQPTHLKTEALDVPELGGILTIRELTAAKAREIHSIKDEALMPVMWAIASIVNDDGTPAFNAKDIHLFDNVSQAAIRRISNAAIRLSGLGESDEDREKNSQASPT